MYSNMCVKIALCLALIVSIDGYVLKQQTVPLSPEGMTVEITVRNNGDKQHPVSIMKIDIDEKDKKVVMSMAEAPFGVLNHNHGLSKNGPNLEDRFAIGRGIKCPVDTIKRGGNLCVPVDRD